jgi:DNA-binding GntR family transcriptional regulator
MAEIAVTQGRASKPKDHQRDKAAQHRLSDIAYRKILEGLFDRTIPAGSFVSQNSLVDALGVPVQPLRDALRVLEAEGVVTIHPRSGIEFLKPDLELARSTYHFRTIIERAAARRYAEVGDQREFASLIEAHESLIREIEGGAFDAAIVDRLENVEEQLHGGMVASLNNPLVENAALRLKNYVRLILMERLLTPPLALRTLKEHLVLLRAIKDRDPDAAEAAVVSHFQAALQRILGMF